MMARMRHIVLIVSALCAGASLAGCANTGSFDLDPSTWFPDGKTKLKGERREVFPGGVPGVTQGVPPELIRGSPQQQAEQNPPAAEAQPAPPPAAKAPQKPRPKKVARSAPPPADADADEAPQQPAARQAPRPAQAAPSGAWPAPQPQAAQQQPQPQQAPANSAWPAPPGSGTFTR